MGSPQFWPEQPFSPVTQYLKPDQYGDSKYLNKVTRFSTVAHLYTKTLAKTNSGNFNGSEILYSLYLAYEDNEHPPYIITDKDQMVKASPRDLSLRFIVDGAEFSRITTRIPKNIFKTIQRMLERHGHYIPEDDEEWDLGEELYKARICLKPIPKLKDPQCLKDIDWRDFIQKLAQWEFERDHRVVLAQKAHLLRGIDARATPHCVMITNGGVGKSSFYSVTTGKLYDKVTRNSLLGYARGPDEIHPGTLDGAQLTVAIDQIESGEWGILDTIFNLMEYGEASLSSGSVELNINCIAPIALLGNVTDHSSPEKGMESILAHLTANPTMGRRIGILLYGNNFKTITQRSSPQRWFEWEKNAQFYRAVEEYALPKLRSIYSDERVWNWLSQEILGYSDAVDQITRGMDAGLVKEFCREHGHSGQSRVRAAALTVSITEHLDLIALDEYDLQEVLDDAEDLVQEFSAINLESVRNLVENAGAEMKACAEAYYRAQPEYVQIIIEAVEYARRNGVLGNTFYLSGIDYKPESEAYPYLSICSQALSRKKRGKSTLNRRLKEFFGFMFEPRDGDLQIITDPTFKARLDFLDKNASSKLSKTSNASKTSKDLENLENLEDLEGLEDTDSSKNGANSTQDISDKEHQSLKKSLFRDLQKLIESLKYLQDQEGSSIKKEMLYEVMHQKYRWNTVFFDKNLRVALRDNSIFQPRPGFYLVTDSEESS